MFQPLYRQPISDLWSGIANALATTRLWGNGMYAGMSRFSLFFPQKCFGNAHDALGDSGACTVEEIGKLVILPLNYWLGCKQFVKLHFERNGKSR